MAETVRVFDVDWMRGMSFGIFPIETSDVESIAKELDTIFANDSDSPSKGIARFVPEQAVESNSGDHVSARIPQEDRDLAAAHRLGSRGNAAARLRVSGAVPARAGTRDDLAAPLPGAGTRRSVRQWRQVLLLRRSAIMGLLVDANWIDHVACARRRWRGTSARRAERGCDTWVPLQKRPWPMNRAGASAIGGRSLEGEAGGGVVTGSVSQAVPDDRDSGISFVADEGNNAIVVSATPGEWRRIRQVLSEVDVMPPQVLIEATIAEVTLTDDLKFGLRWFFEKGGSEFRLTDTLAGAALGPIAPQFAGFSYFLNTTNAKVALNALADITNVNIVSSPSLMVLNNKKAVLADW